MTLVILLSQEFNLLLNLEKPVLFPRPTYSMTFKLILLQRRNVHLARLDLQNVQELVWDSGLENSLPNNIWETNLVCQRSTCSRILIKIFLVISYLLLNVWLISVFN